MRAERAVRRARAALKSEHYRGAHAQNVHDAHSVTDDRASLELGDLGVVDLIFIVNLVGR
jgi:hypothetical protein